MEQECSKTDDYRSYSNAVKGLDFDVDLGAAGLSRGPQATCATAHTDRSVCAYRGRWQGAAYSAAHAQHGLWRPVARTHVENDASVAFVYLTSARFPPAPPKKLTRIVYSSTDVVALVRQRARAECTKDDEPRAR
jgi:hypothetical protein